MVKFWDWEESVGPTFGSHPSICHIARFKATQSLFQRPQQAECTLPLEPLVDRKWGNFTTLRCEWHIDIFYLYVKLINSISAAGGKCNGPPGLRPQYFATYYAAYVLDPDGRNIEAVCMKPGFLAEPWGFFKLGWYSLGLTVAVIGGISAKYVGWLWSLHIVHPIFEVVVIMYFSLIRSRSSALQY